MNNIFEELKIGYKSTWTKEFILTYKELLVLIEYIQEHRKAIILGGDVLHENDQYTGMNWHYGDPFAYRTVGNPEIFVKEVTIQDDFCTIEREYIW